MMAALAIPTAAGAANNSTSAENTCRAQRTAIGATDFKSMYGGTKNAFGKCVSRVASSKAKNTKAAKADCTAQQTADPAGFAAKWGNGKKGANAYGKCVSSTAKASDAKTQSVTINAARTCKSERRAMGVSAFVTKYGTRKNAFGKCVSRTADAKNDAQQKNQ